ncbi:MAG: serine/threonine protein kinase [Planctomycetes bacterium]|nr:serine/threonine protein kinase [Planctomycetota bacterium]
MTPPTDPAGTEILKRDSFGRVEAEYRDGRRIVRRVPCGGAIPGSGLLGRYLARRERRALQALEGLDGVPRLVATADGTFAREFLEGERLDRIGRPHDEFFPLLVELLGRIHDRGVAHNDLAKAANILVRPDGRPALIDFQLAVIRPRRGRIREAIFATMRRDDLRHVLKQKAKRRPDQVTAEDRRRLANRSAPARWWAALGKPVYNFVTRRVLGVADHEGLGLPAKKRAEKADPARSSVTDNRPR